MKVSMVVQFDLLYILAHRSKIHDSYPYSPDNLVFIETYLHIMLVMRHSLDVQTFISIVFVKHQYILKIWILRVNWLLRLSLITCNDRSTQLDEI